MYKVLIVEDEENIRSYIAKALGLKGYMTVTAKNGEEALDKLRDQEYDLVYLDQNLGGKTNGNRVLEALRWRWPETAAIILTGQGSLEDAMTAIKKDVDLYLLKPVTMQQILDAAEESIQKRKKYFEFRSEETEERIIEIGEIRIDKNKLLVEKQGIKVDLTSREYSLLLYLMEHNHRVVPPKELTKAVGGFSPDSEKEARNYIKWYIHQLRQKIEDNASEPKIIVNIREGGYRFIGQSSN